jgi:hypothetical protein
MRCKACRDAIVIQTEARRKDRLDPAIDYPEVIERKERRWMRNQARLDALVRSLDGWPLESAQRPTVGSVLRHPDRPGDQDLIWEDIPLRAFIADIDNSGMRLGDMVRRQNQFGYRLTRALQEGTREHLRATFEYTSSEYGTTSLVFSLIGDSWMPLEVSVFKKAEQKIAPESKMGANNRVNNFRRFDMFSSPGTGLDELKTVYTIRYAAPTAGQAVMPAAIERTVTWLRGNERVVIATEITFDEFRTGKVTCDDVRATMLAIPDNTTAFVLDPAAKNIAWTTKDGHVIKKIDQDAVGIGLAASFASHPKARMLIALNGAALAFGAALYAYRRSGIGRGSR